MNKLTIIGNLTKDPELRSTTTGINVCTFTVAVNRKKSNNQQNNQQPEADFFKVTAWRERGETCAKYLSKGKKVCVIGPVSINTYENQNKKTIASLEVTAEEVEFLSSRNEQPKIDKQTGYQQVETDECPY